MHVQIIKQQLLDVSLLSHAKSCSKKGRKMVRWSEVKLSSVTPLTVTHVTTDTVENVDV